MISFLVEKLVCVCEGYPTKNSRGWWRLVKHFFNSKTSLEYFEHHMKVQFLLDDLLLYFFRMVFENSMTISKVIYSRTMSQFQIYSPPKKKGFTQTLRKQMALLRGGLVSFVATVSMLPGQYAYLFPGTSLSLGPKGGWSTGKAGDVLT